MVFRVPKFTSGSIARVSGLPRRLGLTSGPGPDDLRDRDREVPMVGTDATRGDGCCGSRQSCWWLPLCLLLIPTFSFAWEGVDRRASSRWVGVFFEISVVVSAGAVWQSPVLEGPVSATVLPPESVLPQEGVNAKNDRDPGENGRFGPRGRGHPRDVLPPREAAGLFHALSGSPPRKVASPAVSGTGAPEANGGEVRAGRLSPREGRPRRVFVHDSSEPFSRHGTFG